MSRRSYYINGTAGSTLRIQGSHASEATKSIGANVFVFLDEIVDMISMRSWISIQNTGCRPAEPKEVNRNVMIYIIKLTILNASMARYNPILVQ